jgi:dTDP-4-dehydrorhamnose reductase
MTDLVLGAGGILGAHLRLLRPDAVYVKKTPAKGFLARDLSLHNVLLETLDLLQPKVILNLAGENRVDCVDNGAFDDPVYRINVGLPLWLASWCVDNNCHLVQVSSQGVFSGDHAPYGPWSRPHPITAYGQMKAEAERRVEAIYPDASIVRSTFVLGVRPDPTMGRVNPLETMFTEPVQRQVNDRWFSVAFATDVAKLLWGIADGQSPGYFHLGSPDRMSRYEIAKLANPSAHITPVSDDDFPGARRPLDTTWNNDCLWLSSIEDGIKEARSTWENRSA